jgi:hypothetical protein
MTVLEGSVNSACLLPGGHQKVRGESLIEQFSIQGSVCIEAAAAREVCGAIAIELSNVRPSLLELNTRLAASAWLDCGMDWYGLVCSTSRC